MANVKTRTPIMAHYSPGYGYAFADLVRHPGHVFFVQSTHARALDNVGHGRSPDLPCATLEFAMSLCTASAGDVIYLMPNHVEVVATAGALAMDVNGVTVRGCGWGTIQPIIRWTLAAADMNVTAAGITMENINFQAGVADVLLAIHVTCSDFTIRNCRFTEQTAALNALVWIIDDGAAAASRITVEDCFIYAEDATNDAFIRYTGTGDGHVLRRNVAIGDWDNVSFAGGAGAITNATIDSNYVYTTDATNEACFSFAGGATGVMMNNRVGGGAANGNHILAAGMAKSENYGVHIGNHDLNGILEPAGA